MFYIASLLFLISTDNSLSFVKLVLVSTQLSPRLTQPFPDQFHPARPARLGLPSAARAVSCVTYGGGAAPVR